MSQKEFFDKMVYDAYYSNYEGIVTDKYIDRQDHSRSIIIIRHPIFGDIKRDFSFQSDQIFNFIKIGDSITKKNESLLIKLKRSHLDTIIKLDFGNLKGVKKYYAKNSYVNEN